VDVDVTAALLSALADTIEARDGARLGHPSARGARLRAGEIAEKEALRHFRATEEFTTSVALGAEAYAREMRYFSPLTLVREPQDERAVSLRIVANDA
jgi:hypothetical protein